ncbi:MAG: 4'-phosphopantetheinyl transferase family protein [Desulfurivibrionaceae bacterium]
MLTDLSIPIAEKLASENSQALLDFGLVMARVDLVKYRFPFLVRTRLAEAEKRRLNSLGREKRRQEWLAGRLAAKEAVFTVMSGSTKTSLPFFDYRSVAVIQDEAGRPYMVSELQEVRALDLSISHSSGLAVALASPGRCGIDIQKVDPSLERVQSYFVKETEKKLLGALHHSYTIRQRLALLWSAKEALKKQCSRRPLPGFGEIELTRVRLAEMPVFTMDFRDQSREVAVTFYGSYSLALTMPEIVTIDE